MQRAVEDAIKNYENVDSWKTIILDVYKRQVTDNHCCQESCGKHLS